MNTKLSDFYFFILSHRTWDGTNKSLKTNCGLNNCFFFFWFEIIKPRTLELEKENKTHQKVIIIKVIELKKDKHNLESRDDDIVLELGILVGPRPII